MLWLPSRSYTSKQNLSLSNVLPVSSELTAFTNSSHSTVPEPSSSRSAKTRSTKMSSSKASDDTPSLNVFLSILPGVPENLAEGLESVEQPEELGLVCDRWMSSGNVVSKLDGAVIFKIEVPRGDEARMMELHISDAGICAATPHVTELKITWNGSAPSHATSR